MSFPGRTEAAVPNSESDIVVKGKVDAFIDAILPGSKGKHFGRLYIFNPDFDVLHTSIVGEEILRLRQTLTFWVADSRQIDVGMFVRASLIQADSPDASIHLVPNDFESGSIVYLPTEEEVLFSGTPIPTAFMPVRLGLGWSFRFPNPLHRQYKEDIRIAAEMWKKHLPAYVTFESLEYPIQTGAVPDMQFDITFGTPTGSAIGYTYYWTPRQDPKDHSHVGTIVFRKMKQNGGGVPFPWSPPGKRATARETDFVSVCAHEIGHALGLGHLSDPNDVMYPSRKQGDVRNDLSSNDIAAVQSLYPSR